MEVSGGYLDGRARRYAFVALVLAILAIGTGHLYLIDGLTTIRFGLPTWLWVQLGVVAGLLALAWVAIGFVPETGGGKR